MTPHVGFFGQMFGVWEWSEIIWVVVIALIVQFVLRRTRFGVRVIATGGSPSGPERAAPGSPGDKGSAGHLDDDVPRQRAKPWASR